MSVQWPVMPDGGGNQPWSHGLYALGGAYQRLQEATRAESVWMASAELGTALLWVIALDDEFENRWPTDHSYRQDRSRFVGDETFLGVRWARNLVGHRLARIVQVRDLGVSFPRTFPFSFPRPRWVWPSSRELLADGGTEDKRSARLRGHYDAHLAGQLIPGTLTTVQEWLWEAEAVASGGGPTEQGRARLNW